MKKSSPRVGRRIVLPASALKRNILICHLSGWFLLALCNAAHASAPLPPPKILSAIPGIGQVTLAWGGVSGATSYEVFLRKNGAHNAPIRFTTSRTQLLVRGLSDAYRYYFSVSAVSNGVPSRPSSPIESHPVPPALARPVDLVGIAAGSTVDLSWTDVGATSYDVYEGTDPSMKTSRIVDQVSETTSATLSANITGLKNDRTYFFEVHAVVPGATGPASGPVSNEVAIKIATKGNSTTPISKAPLAFFQLGVSLLNPYHITTTAPITLSPASGTDTNAFLEFLYTNRLAWNQQRLIQRFPHNAVHYPPEWYWPGKVWDVQARLGYTFTNSGKTSANTIVGSGNFDGELSVGFPIVAVENERDVSDYTVGPILGYSAVTDKSALQAHQMYFGGVSYATSLEDPLGDKSTTGAIRRILLEFRLVYARLDTIRYVSSSSTQISTTNGTLPRYFSKWSVGFESELLYPLNKTSFVTFRGQIYPELTPGLWSIQIGFSTPFSKLFGSFFK